MKLLQGAKKVLERVIVIRVRNIVKQFMQFGFMRGRSITDAIFIVCQLWDT